MTSFNKTDLVKIIAERQAMPRAQVQAVVDDLLGLIQDVTAKGGKVSLMGFGVFAERERAARTGRNPATGLPIDIPASSALHFKASKPKKADA